MLVVLRQRNLRLLLAGELISLIGDRALKVALPYFVYQQTNSTAMTAALVAVFYLPGLLFGSFAGVLADRWDRRRVLVASHTVQALVMLGMLLAPVPGLLWVAYAVMFVELTVSTLATPAAAALLPSLVPDAQLPRANALFGLTRTTARITGPLVGGVLIGVFGLHSVILFDGLTFLLAAALFARLALPTRPNAASVVRPVTLAAAWQGVLREWREGLRLVPRHQVLLALFVTLNVTSLGGSLVDPLWVPFVHDQLNAGPLGLGLLSTTVAAGALLGGVIAGWFADRLSPRRSVGWLTLLVGLMMVAVYQQTLFPVALVLLFVLGIPLVVSNVAAATLLQRSVPDAYRGRVHGALGTTNALMGFVAVAVGGLLGQVVGIVPMLTAAGGITIVAGVLGVLLLPRTSASGSSEGRADVSNGTTVRP